jgi:GR25 family glycosyltransferase involved in LPS biosynthesis
MEGGIHMFCINLKHRGDRWARFSKQPELQVLQNAFTFERFEAINGSAIDIPNDSRISLRTKRNIREHIRRDHEELDSAGGVGAYLSHTTVWKKFLERPEAYAMIFEDDAIIPPGFTQDFQSAMRDVTLLPQVPDVWYFNKPSSFYFETKGLPHPYTVKEQNLGPWTTKTCAAFTAYLISKQGAQKLLETAFPIDMHVDLYSCLNGDLGRIFTVSHRAVDIRPYELRSGDTDIQVSDGCSICSIPTNYQQRGMVVVSVPALLIGATVAAYLWYLGQTTSKRIAR